MSSSPGRNTINMLKHFCQNPAVESRDLRSLRGHENQNHSVKDVGSTLEKGKGDVTVGITAVAAFWECGINLILHTICVLNQMLCKILFNLCVAESATMSRLHRDLDLHCLLKVRSG